MLTKVCNVCKEDLPLDKFNSRSASSDGKMHRCRECDSIVKKKWYRENKEKCKKKSRTHYIKNRDYKIKYQREYNENNKDRIAIRRKKYNSRPDIKDSKNKWSREKRKTDINYKISQTLRARLNQAIKKGYKAGSAVKDLGCSIDEFKEYIAKKFQPGMTWENWGKGKGKWSLDHILPLSYFDLSNREEFLKAVHYTNFQPLWSGHNLSKHTKVPEAFKKSDSTPDREDFEFAVKEGLGYQALAYRFGIKHTEVRKYLNKWDLSIMVPDAYKIPKEELRSLYKTAKMTRKDIAEYFGVSKAMVDKMLIDYNIPPNTERGHLEDLLTEETLLNMLEERKKVPQICEELGVKEASVHRYMRIYDLSSRLSNLYSTEELQELADQGFSSKEIGEKLGLTKAQAKSLLRTKKVSTALRKTGKGDRVDEKFLKPLLCRECGVTDKDRFNGGCRQICKTCSNRQARRNKKKKLQRQ